MPRSEHLPIYKAAYDLCLWLEQVVRGFSRYHKFSLGSDLRDGSRRILRLVVRVNSSHDKAPVLRALPSIALCAPETKIREQGDCVRRCLRRVS